jgi:hypothetical protein
MTILVARIRIGPCQEAPLLLPGDPAEWHKQPRGNPNAQSPPETANSEEKLYPDPATQPLVKYLRLCDTRPMQMKQFHDDVTGRHNSEQPEVSQGYEVFDCAAVLKEEIQASRSVSLPRPSKRAC